MAARVTGAGALKLLPGCDARVGEVYDRGTGLFVDGDLDVDVGALVHLAAEVAVLQPRQQAAHALFRVVLHVTHVGLDHVESEVRDHLLELADAFGVGGDMCLEVGDVLVGPPRGVLGARQQRIRLGFEEAAAVDQFEVVDVDAFLVDVGGARRHRTRRQPADVLVVAAAGDVE